MTVPDEDWDPLKTAGPPPWLRTNAAVGDSHLAAAVACHKTGKLGDAIAGYRAVLESEPEHRDAMHQLGLALIAQGDVREGLDTLWRALSLGKPPAAHLTNLAIALLSLGRMDAARAQLRLALQTDPDYADALSLEARLAVVMERFEDAAGLFQRLRAVKPNDATAAIGAAFVLARLGRGRQAERVLDDARRFLGDRPDLALARADVLALSGDPQAPAAYYAAALVAENDDVKALALAAAARSAIRRGREGESLAKAALALAPANAAVWGQAAEAADAEAAALAALNRASRLDPHSAAWRLALARVLGRRGDHAGALRLLDAAARLAPGQPVILAELGEAMVAAGRFDQAAAFFSDWAAEAEDHPVPAYRAAALTGKADHMPAAAFAWFADRALDDPAADKVDAAHRTLTEGGLRVLPASEMAESTLDLGGGGGRLGRRLRPLARTLTAVDACPRGAEAARRTGCYDAVVAADPLGFAEARRAAYDRIIAGDVLRAYGDLTTPIRTVVAALRPNGVALAVVDLGADGESVRLRPTGWFTHSADHVRYAVEEGGARVIASGDGQMPAEAGYAGPALLAVIQRLA